MLYHFLLLLFQHKLLLALLLIGLLLAHKIHRYYTSPLRKQGIPGPFLAGFTNLYRFYFVLRRTWHRDLTLLHEKYGTVIWITPNEISISDPKMRNIVYGFADHRKDASFFRKGPIFETGLFNEDFSFLFETNPDKARLGKYTLSQFLSEKGVRGFDEDFDMVVSQLIEGLTVHHVEKHVPCDFSLWSSFFMFDLGVKLACNYSTGLCLAGRDFGGAVDALRTIFDVVGTLMPLPLVLQITTRWIRKMLLHAQLEKLYSFALCSGPNATKEERVAAILQSSPQHILARLGTAAAKTRSVYPDGNRMEGFTNGILNHLAGTVGAGATVIPYIIRRLIQHPDVLEKVRLELAAMPAGIVPISVIQNLNGTQPKLQYLEAMILETIRLSPSLGFSLSRVVPEIGCTLGKYDIPAGYIVGASAVVMNIDKDYFGEDATEFKPERWLGNHPWQLAKDGSGNPRKMKDYIEAGWLSFGAGGRVCAGRHIATIALMKSTSELVRQFDMCMVREPSEWFGFFVHLDSMIIDLKKRETV